MIDGKTHYIHGMRGKGRDLLSAGSLPRMATITGAGWCWHQEPGISLESSMRVSETQVLEYDLLYLFPEALSRTQSISEYAKYQIDTLIGNVNVLSTGSTCYTTVSAPQRQNWFTDCPCIWTQSQVSVFNPKIKVIPHSLGVHHEWSNNKLSGINKSWISLWVRPGTVWVLS